jgi:UDPglucose 6-dehydrogenase/GDP-mannose 6-dehydrogenase
VKISIVGTGYVGLVSGVCMAAKGHDVTCVDIDRSKVDRINRGDPPIHEAGLEALLKANLGTRFRATTDLAEAVAATELTMIAVGTPFDGDEIDLGYIREASRQIGEALGRIGRYHVVLVKSTVVPGTTQEVVAPILEAASGRRAGKDFGLGMNPEFLREGVAVSDFMEPDRIVLGGIDERTLEVLDRAYAPFEGVDVLRTDPRTAETIKYAANALLASLISFSNEIGNLCARLDGVDVTEVMRGVHLDRRISPLLEDGSRIKPALTTYLEAGCGFGGSCFPKDVKALIAYGSRMGSPMRVLDSVIDVNARQPARVLELLGAHFPDLSGVRVTVLGLAFKPGTDDMRESPAIPVVQALLAQGAKVRAFDPVAEHEARRLFGEGALEYARTLDAAVTDTDAVLLMTRWPEFATLPELFAGMARQPLLVDGRRMLDKASFTRYEGIGLRSAPSRPAGGRALSADAADLEGQPGFTRTSGSTRVGERSVQP